MLICPNCSSSDVRHFEVRRNKMGDVQRWLCRECKRKFSTPLANRVPRLLFIDIETALMEIYTYGLYKQHPRIQQIKEEWYVLSWAAKWAGEPEIMSNSVTPAEAIAKDDRRIMESVWKLLDDADVIVAHNGNRFDRRKMNARFITHDMNFPMPYQVIDTYKSLARVAAMTSYKQDYLTKHFGLPEKLPTDLQLWIDCNKGDPKALAKMLSYNERDVSGLEALYFRIRKYLPAHPNMGLFTDSEEAVCPVCTSGDITWEDKYYTTNVGKYQAGRCACGAIGISRFTALSKAQRKHLIKSPPR